MPLQIFIYITLLMIWMLPLYEANAEDSIINQYDTNGSLVSGDGKFYEYNDANQLVRVREKDAIGAVVAEYFYDHTGQRVKKVESGVTTYYLGKYYETQVVQDQAQNTSYYFAEGDRVAKKDSTGTYYYHPDHLGGTSAVTNSTGQVVSSTSYLPFGDVRQGGAEKYSYTGKEMDKATGLYNFDARYTSPELRHFTQADIADPDFDDPQDLNRYAYVGNNPLSYVDLDGYKKKKKAKLSKREKWMIAHGVDPDHDKTTLKKAKKLEKAGKKYVVSAKKNSGTPRGSGVTGAGAVLGASTEVGVPNSSNIGQVCCYQSTTNSDPYGPSFISAPSDDDIKNSRIQRRFKELLEENQWKFANMEDSMKLVYSNYLNEQAKIEIEGESYSPPSGSTIGANIGLSIVSIINSFLK